MRTKGKIATWNAEKGFGFIAPLSGGKQVFAHISAFANRSRQPEIGRLVSYVPSSDKRGRPCADSITFAGERLQKQRKQNNGWLAPIGGLLFLALVGASIAVSKTPPLVLGLYVLLSLITFLAYAMDKAAAQRHAWRTPESTLHLLALCGGWPGAIIAQQVLRHKSKKRSFRSVFWVTVALNCAAFAWTLTPTGADALHSFVTQVAFATGLAP